jgi:transcriptional regulator with XRE-family HTH domain
MYIDTQLRKLRDKRKISQQEIADHLDVVPPTLSVQQYRAAGVLLNY